MSDTAVIPEAISNTEDYIDSRDMQDRIEYLEKELKAHHYESDRLEYGKLLQLKKQYVDSFGESSWSFGAQFIRDSYFEDYAQELAEDIGAIDRKAHWPLGCIDWEQAARELQMDYTEVEFDGVTYWTREA